MNPLPAIAALIGAYVAPFVALVLRGWHRLVADLVQLGKMGLDQAALTHDLAMGGEDYWANVLGGLRRERRRRLDLAAHWWLSMRPRRRYTTLSPSGRGRSSKRWRACGV